MLTSPMVLGMDTVYGALGFAPKPVSLVSLAEACLGFNKGARCVILDSLAGVTSAHLPWVARNLNSIARFLALM